MSGVMSFFGADHHKEMGPSMHQDETGQRATKKFILDISDEIDFDSFSGDVDFRINRKGGDKDDLRVEQIQLERRQLQN